MSGRGPNAAPVVVREYRHSQDECVRALELLLRKAISNMAVERAPEPDGHDEAKELKHGLRTGCGVLRGGTSVGAVVRMRGGDHVETSPVRTDQRTQRERK
jgi:hypothetical protein